MLDIIKSNARPWICFTRLSFVGKGDDNNKVSPEVLLYLIYYE